VPTFQIESTFQGLVGGVDEVGRGPWAGPVVAAAAVFLDPVSLPSSLLEDIQDSKKLSKVKREIIFKDLLRLETFQWGLGSASVEEIDRLNILKATFLAMERAIKSLPQVPSTLLIDGKHIPRFEGIQTHPLIGGDGVSLSIAAASIIAKVTRDKMMEELAKAHPFYGWETNAGYGTAQHQNALKIHGITPHHRKSFAPIRALVA
jgi:ribonuclease HII